MKDLKTTHILFLFLMMVILLTIGFCVPEGKPIKKNESYYQNLFSKYIKSDQTEYRLDDNSRVDIITQTHAIEIDYGYKWYESIGQSLFYSIKTGLQPGIVLLIDNHKYLDRLLIVAEKYNIKIWTIDLKSEKIRSF
jgi:hypothetical protein